MRLPALLRLPILVGLVASAGGATEEIRFVTPIGGVPYEDWTILNYVDLDPGPGAMDYRGGYYTYDGHNAIDYMLPNFAAMDAGVPVYAAADGTVLVTDDGWPDRCSSEFPCDTTANIVIISHGGGLATWYLHLKRNSISVSIGEPVVAGQQIAEVGSSGMSSDAHLHFAVVQNAAPVETYLDPERWWLDPLPYAGDVPGSLDSGLTDFSPDYPDLRERPPEVRVFPDEALHAFYWVQLHGIPEGAAYAFRWWGPDGQEAHRNQGSFYYEIMYDWETAALFLPGKEKGDWEVSFEIEGEELSRDAFHVPEPGSALLRAVALACLGLVAAGRRGRG